MNRRRGGIFALTEDERGELLAFGRQGLRFLDIGRQLNISSSTAHIYWTRDATAPDKAARAVVIADSGARSRSKRNAGRDVPARQIGPDFVECVFTDDRRAIASDQFGRVNRAEPFGFSLYGGTFR
jgi:hypothetical protein